MSATEPWFKKRRNNVLNMLSSETLHLAVKKKKKAHRNRCGFLPSSWFLPHWFSLSFSFSAAVWSTLVKMNLSCEPFTLGSRSIFHFFTISRTQPHTHATEITLLSVFTIPSTICKITLCIPLCPEQALLFISDNYFEKNIIFLLFTIVSCKKLPFLLTISVLG